MSLFFSGSLSFFMKDNHKMCETTFVTTRYFLLLLLSFVVILGHNYYKSIPTDLIHPQPPQKGIIHKKQKQTDTEKGTKKGREERRLNEEANKGEVEKIST